MQLPEMCSSLAEGAAARYKKRRLSEGLNVLRQLKRASFMLTAHKAARDLTEKCHCRLVKSSAFLRKRRTLQSA